jgi:TM2 domain-containing membrane protein YozV
MKKSIGIIITIFGGLFGVHRFMAGKTVTGIIWLCTGGILGLGWLFDILNVSIGAFTNKEGYIWAP